MTCKDILEIVAHVASIITPIVGFALWTNARCPVPLI